MQNTHTHSQSINLCNYFSLFPLTVDHLIQSVADFSGKDQIVNTLGFADHMVSAATTQLCCHSTKAARKYVKNGCDSAQLKL